MEENLKSIKNSSLNKTWLLVAGLVILTVALLVVSLNSKNFPGLPTSSKDVKTDFAHTSLAISEYDFPFAIKFSICSSLSVSSTLSLLKELSGFF